MRRLNGLVVVFVAGAALAASASASVGVYYIDAYGASLWSQGTVPTQSWGPTIADGYAPSPAALLTGDWLFSQTSQIDAPTGSVVNIGAGSAHGEGTLAATINSNGFSVQGFGLGQAASDTSSAAPRLDAEGAVQLIFNFEAPAGPGQALVLNGSMTADPTQWIYARLTDVTDPDPANYVYLLKQTTTTTFDNVQYPMVPGHLYEVVLSADAGVSSTDGTLAASLATFDVTGTFVVPEPVLGAVVVSGSLVALSRRKRLV